MLLSSFPRVRALAVSGPFALQSGSRWAADGPIAQVLTVDAYREELVDHGHDDAQSIAEWLRLHGARHVVWAHGEGSRRGRAEYSWSVRIAALDGTSAPRLDTLAIGDGVTATLPEGDLTRLAARDAVLRVALRVPTPQASEARPAKGLRRQRATDVGVQACVVLGVGRLGATVVVTAPDAARAESAAACLAGLVASDMEEAMAPSGGAAWYQVS